MISHDSTNQVTSYRRASTRRNQLAPSSSPIREIISAMDMSSKKDRTSGPELLRRGVRRVSMEGAAETRRKSAEEYEVRMAAGVRLQTAWRKQREGLREIKPALTLTVPEKHHRRNEVEPGQVLTNPSDIRPIAGTKEKTLRALAIHIVQNQLAGLYAGINPEEVNADDTSKSGVTPREKNHPGGPKQGKVVPTAAGKRSMASGREVEQVTVRADKTAV